MPITLILNRFINWEVHEEQKVAALVSGSKTIKKIINELFEAINDWENEAEKYDLKLNKKLQKVGKKARQADMPISYVYRIIHLSKNRDSCI